MNSANLQIVAAYEDAGVSPEIISEQFGWELEAVKAVLMSCSKKFYGEVMDQQKSSAEHPGPSAENEQTLFSSFEVQQAKSAIAGLIHGGEDDHIRFRAAKFVIDEAKGRNDVKSIAKNTFNISIINERMKAAKAAQIRSREIGERILAGKEILVA